MGNHHAKPTATDASATRTLQLNIPPHISNQYMDDCDASKYTGLAANAAFDLAKRCRVRFGVSVAIQFTMADTDSLSPAYDRLWFKIRTPSQLSAAMVRATAITWCLLAQCPGYGVDQNPEFWRRIFAILYSPGRTSEALKSVVRSSALVPGGVSLHPRGCGSAFPRIGVLFCDAPSVDTEIELWRIVCGIDEHYHPSLQGVLDDVLAQLAPHVRPSGKTIVDISFCMAARSDVVPSPSQLNKFVQPALVPLFHVSSIFETEPRNSERTRATIVNANRRMLLHEVAPPAASDHVVVDERLPVEWTRTRDLRYDAVIAMFASLPYTQSSLTSVHYLSMGYLNEELWELPWIRYAMFHPDAIQSSWTKLKVQLNRAQLTSLAQESIPFYEDRGNGPALSSTGTYENTASRLMKKVFRPRLTYSRVLLTAGTVLRSCRNVNKPPILTLPTPTYVDLLEHTPPRTGEWRNVIVRSIGSCWVMAGDIGPVEHRPALKSPCIQELTLEIGSTYYHDVVLPDSLAYDVLRIAINLTKLDIESIGRFSNSSVNMILEANPLLKSLSIANDGSLWRDESIVRHRRSKWPRLEELKLVIRIQPGARFYAPSEMSITTGSLRNLRSFVAVIASEKMFDVSQRDFAWLINTHAKLSYVVISTLENSEQAPTRDYAQWKYLSEQRLLAAGVKRSIVMGQSSRSVKAIVLMSVVSRLHRQQRQRRGNSPLAAFGSDVVECVLAFIGNSDSRIVWFGPTSY